MADEVERLLKEIHDLRSGVEREERIAEIGRQITEPTDVVADRGRVSYTVSTYASDVERDEKGFISRIVGPEKTHTIVRDDMHRVVRIETETEELSGE